jgi:heme oxygenase
MNILLSSELRTQTLSHHKEAEGSEFMRRFMKGMLTESSYLDYLKEFLNIYSAMEEFLNTHQSDVNIQKIYFPELFRKNEIKEDIDFFSTRNKEYHAMNYSLSYISHIKSLKKPNLIIAHSYVRYFGDLSGGQILKKIVSKNFNLSDDNGVSFYNFKAINDINQFKEKYRRALDSLELKPDEKIEIIEEAKKVFQLNNQLFSMLDSNVENTISTN